MTWDEIICKIRLQPEFNQLVEHAYLDADLNLNVERFHNSIEYQETKELIRRYAREQCSILDIGSGNGISAVSFALDGWKVTACEPDRSSTVGSGAIRTLKEGLKLNNLEVVESWGEQLPFENESFDIVYIRQAMHHAADLNRFVSEASRVLKKNGLLLTIRDHVVFNAKDKRWFLNSHPLHKFYGGENAYTEKQYVSAFRNGGLQVLEVLRYHDSSINYFPNDFNDYKVKSLRRQELIDQLIKKRVGILSRLSLVYKILFRFLDNKLENFADEKSVPGRMYSFVCVKR